MSSSSRHGAAHSPCWRDLERALVGDAEVADLLDLVAPELDAQRVVLGGREDIEDAAPDGEVAALLDQLGAGVAGVDQVGDDVGQFAAGVSRAQDDRAQLTQPRYLRLEQRAHRGDEGTDRAGGRVVGGRMGQPAQHGQPLPDGVRARREPLVRQGLPTGVERDLIARQQAAEGRHEVLGLASGAGHGEHRRLRVRVRHRRDGQRLERGRRGERPRRRCARRHRELGQRRVGQGGGKQAGQGQRGASRTTQRAGKVTTAQHNCPHTRTGGGITSAYAAGRARNDLPGSIASAPFVPPDQVPTWLPVLSVMVTSGRLNGEKT